MRKIIEAKMNRADTGFQLKVLQARLDIRDFFLKTTVREIYENVGQVLSVIRMQLAVLHPIQKELTVENLASSGDLVGQSIRDLRSMSRSFYPDEDIVKEGGLHQAITNTLHILEFNETKITGDSNSEAEMEDGVKLIAFKIVLEVLISISEAKLNLKHLHISNTKKTIAFSLSFFNAEKIAEINVNIIDLLNFINATYTATNTDGLNKIKLIIPKSFYHE